MSTSGGGRAPDRTNAFLSLDLAGSVKSQYYVRYLGVVLLLPFAEQSATVLFGGRASSSSIQTHAACACQAIAQRIPES